MRAMADALQTWLSDTLGDEGPFELTPLSGGNSNETVSVTSASGRWILRRPPAASLAPGAHAMEREHVIMEALSGQPVPSPRTLGVLVAEDVPQTPALLMEHVDGVSLTDTLPSTYPSQPDAAAAIGEAVIDALAELHAVPWRDAGLAGFGRPDGFLERQVPRWRKQLERYRTRDLPYLDELTSWLGEQRPERFEPGIMHGDFHLDNCLLTPAPPVRVAAIVDWEMATIGDPLMDLGLFLAFWGDDRPADCAMPRVQAVSRVAGAPSRSSLAARYAERSSRSVERIDWYCAMAFYKLAMIVEGAYAQYLDGRLRPPYAAALEHDVPSLLREAAGFARVG
jgi:aminoglycoside phosphotransferase (APT) family kinase protein